MDHVSGGTIRGCMEIHLHVIVTSHMPRTLFSLLQKEPFDVQLTSIYLTLRCLCPLLFIFYFCYPPTAFFLHHPFAFSRTNGPTTRQHGVEHSAQYGSFDTSSWSLPLLEDRGHVLPVHLHNLKHLVGGLGTAEYSHWFPGKVARFRLGTVRVVDHGGARSLTSLRWCSWWM